jgi:hypothetical protein
MLEVERQIRRSLAGCAFLLPCMRVRPPIFATPARPKRRGELAELAFINKALALGFGVAKPWGDSDRYDYILDTGHSLWRVQVEAFCGREAERSEAVNLQPKS